MYNHYYLWTKFYFFPLITVKWYMELFCKQLNFSLYSTVYIIEA